MHIMPRAFGSVVVALSLFWAIAPQPAVASGTPRIVLAQGTVRTPSGAAIAGADVIAVAWPKPESLKNMKVGDSFVPRVIGSTATDVRGVYSLALTTDGAMNVSGKTNVEFVTVTSGGSASHFATAEMVTSTRAAGLQAAGRATLFVNGKAAAQGQRIDFTVARGKVGSVAASKIRTAGSVPSYCTLSKNHGGVWVQVGSVYSSTSGKHTRQFVYAESADSTLGVATSATGAYGSFKASGTVSASSTDQVAFAKYNETNPNGRLLKTKFKFATFKCSYPVTYTITDYKVYPTGFLAGATSTEVTTPFSSYCVPFEKGTGFTMKRSTASTFSAGVSLGAAIGINLSARTGFASEAKIVFTFGSNRQLCGTQDEVTGSPGRVVVK